MFKVFNRGHKVQFNERSSNTTMGSIGSASLAMSYDQIRRRSNNVRNSTAFADNDLDTLSMSTGPHTTNLTSKKYVSCDNFAQNSFYEDEYQEVIDEESDDAGLRDRLKKRYNSLTNLLMRSFRKAKIKKKKEAMLQESLVIDELGSTNQLADERRSRLANHEAEKHKTRSTRNLPTPSTSGAYLEAKEKDSSDEDLTHTVQTNNNNNNSNKNPPDESMPVFKGVKMISNEFVDYESRRPNSSVRLQDKNNLIGLSNVPSVTKNLESMLKNQTIRSLQPIKAEPTSIYSTILAKKSTSVQRQPATNTNDHAGKIEQTSALEILQKFSSHMKPQAPKPPPIPVPAALPVAVERVAITHESNQPEQTSSPEVTYKKPLTVKRSKTFTQQLQDMLKDHRVIAKQTATDLNSPGILISRNNSTPSATNSIVELKHSRDKSVEKFSPPSVENNLTLSMNSNANMSELTVSSLCADSSPKQQQQQRLIRIFEQQNKTEISRLDNLNLRDTMNPKCSNSRNELKSIEDFNKIQIQADEINRDLEDHEEDEEEEVTQKSCSSNENDDFKDLIQVLGRQEIEFKKKFFDCLMTKLWDTSLPINEYVQLNKLMTALFGETYHKMDLSCNGTGHSSTQSIRSGKIDYLNLKSTKNSKVDAEYIVNLMKVYLDSKTSKKNNYKHSEKSSNENITNDLSISNLVSSLRARQKHETNMSLSRITPRSSNFNLIGANIYDLEDKLQLYGTEFSFRNGFNGLNNQLGSSSRAKSSLVLKLDEKYDEDEINYNRENFINHSFIDDDCSVRTVQAVSNKSNFVRDSNSRKTPKNLDRTLFQRANTSTSTFLSAHQQTFSQNSDDHADSVATIQNNKKINIENKITKLIKLNSHHMNSPHGSYLNEKSTTSINTNTNDESFVPRLETNKLNLSIVSDFDQRSGGQATAAATTATTTSTTIKSTSKNSSKRIFEIQLSKNAVKSNGDGLIASFQPSQEINLSNGIRMKAASNTATVVTPAAPTTPAAAAHTDQNNISRVLSPHPSSSSTSESKYSNNGKNDKLLIKQSYNVIRTVVQPPKPKLVQLPKPPTPSVHQQQPYTCDSPSIQQQQQQQQEYSALKKKQFKVVNILNNINDNMLSMKNSSYSSNENSMRKRDGQFTEPKFNYHLAPQYHTSKTPEPIYQVQKIAKKQLNDFDSSNAVFNPNGSHSHRTSQRTNNSSINSSGAPVPLAATNTSPAYVYVKSNGHGSVKNNVEKKTSRSLNQLNDDYQQHYFNTISKKYTHLHQQNQSPQQQYQHQHQQQLQHHSYQNKSNGIEYSYEPKKKLVSHQLKDLMTEKIYKFERREMQQAFY